MHISFHQFGEVRRKRVLKTLPYLGHTTHLYLGHESSIWVRLLFRLSSVRRSQMQKSPYSCIKAQSYLGHGSIVRVSLLFRLSSVRRSQMQKSPTDKFISGTCDLFVFGTCVVHPCTITHSPAINLARSDAKEPSKVYSCLGHETYLYLRHESCTISHSPAINLARSDAEEASKVYLCLGHVSCVCATCIRMCDMAHS